MSEKPRPEPDVREGTPAPPARLSVRNGGFWGKRTLEKMGLPYNRENYIRLNWGRDIPNEEWTSEDEMELPPELREGFDRD